jgi:hypothetical protein
MSDNFSHRLFSGNFQSEREHPTRQIGYRGRRRLVEECQEVSVHDVRRVFGKKLMIAAVRQARPLRLPVRGAHFDIWPVDEPHRLPATPERWSSVENGTARLWLLCAGCRRKVGKLYYYYAAPDSVAPSGLLCRRCHRLVYLSANCGKNRWYREIARPVRWLLREKSKLLAKAHTLRNADRLAQIESAIQTLKQKLRPKTQRRREDLSPRLRSRQRRPYRDLCLLEQ